MSKSDYSVAIATDDEAESILENWHYLSVLKLSKRFKRGLNVGLFHGGKDIGEGVRFGADAVGVCIFTGLPVPEIAESLFGLCRTDQDGLLELSRLCLDPSFQKSEHNLASWFVARAMKIAKGQGARAVLSYADADFHSGTVYAAANFKYYGLSDPKKDFWFKADGVDVKHSRGPVKGKEGEWRDRSRKHRFVMVFDKKLKPRWTEERWNNERTTNAGEPIWRG